MATFDMSILGHVVPDTSGDVYPSNMALEMALTNSKRAPVYVLGFPTGADIGLEGVFSLPQNYVSTPLVIFRGIIDGTPANVFGVGVQQITVAAAATTDVAYEAEDVASNSTWTGYADEEYYELAVTITPTATYTPGNPVFIKAYRDDSVDTQTINFLLTDLIFRYNDA